MWNYKVQQTYDCNEKEIGSQTQRTRQWLQWGQGSQEGKHSGEEVSVHTTGVRWAQGCIVHTGNVAHIL